MVTNAEVFRTMMEVIWGEEPLDPRVIPAAEPFKELAEDQRFFWEDALVTIKANFPDARVEPYTGVSDNQLYQAHFTDGSTVTFGHHEVH